MSESWPSRNEPPPPALPRVEELPIVTEGYDRQKVREAFDAFYRHAAQLDTALRTLEAVDAFQRSAAELRGDLRAIRAAGFAAQTWQRPYGTEARIRRPLLPEAFPRVAVEVIFLIAVAVALGVSGWGALPVIGVMALALVIVWAVELLASRERPARPAVRRAAVQPAAPAVETPAAAEQPAAAGWAAYAERGERDDAMTIVEPLPGSEPVAELEAPEEEAEIVEVAVEAVVVPVDESELDAEADEVRVEDEPLEEAEVVAEAEPTDDDESEPAEASRIESSGVDAQPEEPEVEPSLAEAPEPQVDAPELQEAAREPGEPGGDVEELVAEDEQYEARELEALPGEPASEDDDVAAEASPAPRPSLWQRMRGRGIDSAPVLVEPPRGALVDGEVIEPTVGRDDPHLRVDEVGLVGAEESAEPETQLDELGVVEDSEPTALVPESEDEDATAEFGDEPSSRRSFWRRRREPEAQAAAIEESAEPSEAVAETEPELLQGEAAIDPWEQGLEFPVEPELEPIEAERELAPGDGEEPGADALFDQERIDPEQQFEDDDGQEPKADVPAVQEPLVLAEDEPLARSMPEAEDEPLDSAAAEHEDDESAILAEAPAVGDGADPHPAARAQSGELPIEVLAEQAAAALQRSRARRRHLRRARRR